MGRIRSGEHRSATGIGKDCVRKEDNAVKAAVFYGPGDIRVQEVAAPQAGPGDMIVRVRAAAVCGTDLRIFASGFNRPELQGSGRGRILGHEVAGDVADAGKDVKEFRRGDRVTIAPNVGCGTCAECVRGLDHLCRDYKAIGIALDGGFADYVLFPARAIARGNVCKIPADLSYEEAAVNEPLSCCFNGQEACNVGPGDVVLVLGAGPIGALHLLLARFAGARSVIISDLVEERLEAVDGLGPDAAINPTRDDLGKVVERETHGRGADVVIVACSSPEAQREALELAGLGGRINFFGGLPAGRENVTLNTNLIHYKQLVVTGTTRSSIHQFRRTLDILASRKVDIQPTITGRLSLEEIHKAFESPESLRGLKTVILP